MKEFKMTELEIVRFEEEDVIVTSIIVEGSNMPGGSNDDPFS